MNENLINEKIKPWEPTEDGENVDTLIVHLEEVIKGGKATNIGVIGPYGSGKSSFIATFLKKKRRTDSVIRVSLASFDTEDTDKRALEVGIVQQILYRFDPEKTPLSRFHRIVYPNFLQFIIFLYPLLFYFGFINYLIIDSFLQKYIYLVFNILYYPFLTYWDIKSIYVLAYFFLICSLGYICWTLYQTIFNWRTISISTPIGSIGLDKSQTTILDQYLEEILYVFDANSQKRIVIFEDMDRFDNTIKILTIFTKLREINHLLNNRGKKPIIFIYAIREDLIPKPEDRVKFFNFIISIIPYSDQNNSESRLIQEFPDNNRDLLELISIYIYDYRFIQHIQNEFLFINNILNKKNKLSIDTILALVCYKNLYPNDFNSLRNNTGDLYSGIELVRKFGLEQYHQNLKNYDDFETELQGENTIDSNQLNLISRLLISEYIGIDYYDYISHFIPGKMGIHDWDFVRKVRLVNINKDLQTQQLINPTLVIDRLELEYFTRGWALNYSVFFQLLDDKFFSTEKSTSKLQELLNYITQKDKNGQFIYHEFINGLISEKGILLQPKYINEPLKDIISEYNLNFSKISSKIPPDLLQFIVHENYYILNEMNLKQIYDLSLKSLWDMSYYWEKAKELSEDIANKVLENIITTINGNESSPTLQEQIKEYPIVDYVPMLKEIILQPSLYNLSFIDNLKNNNIVITYDGDYVEKLQNLSFNRIKVLIENDMIVVELFISISTNNKTLSDDEKIKLWNIYIEKDRDLVQKELTTPALDIIFPDWGILKKGSSFTINNNQDNLNFCEFLKENKSISSYYNYIKGESIQVNRTKSK
jgi:hypothetical protein